MREGWPLASVEWSSDRQRDGNAFKGFPKRPRTVKRILSKQDLER